MNRCKAAVIVPAYNEEATIGDVVRALVASEMFYEVIVVCDGSQDRTADRAREAGATLVHACTKNRGKGAALAIGVRDTDAPVICFFDADLVGLTTAHITTLVDPVVSGALAMTIGVRDRGVVTGTIARSFKIGGQRALRREIFERLPQQCVAGYKIETALTFFCTVQAKAYAVVTLAGLRFVRKIEKEGLFAGVIGYIKMSAQIAWAIIECRLLRAAFLEREEK